MHIVYTRRMQVRLSMLRTELLHDLSLEELHLSRLAVHQHHVTRLTLPNQLHDALRVGVRTEAHVLYRHLHIHLSIQTCDVINVVQFQHKTTMSYFTCIASCFVISNEISQIQIFL